jgi:hypothetical protein
MAFRGRSRRSTCAGCTRHTPMSPPRLPGMRLGLWDSRMSTNEFPTYKSEVVHVRVLISPRPSPSRRSTAAGSSQASLVPKRRTVNMQYAQAIAYPTPHIYYSTGGDNLMWPSSRDPAAQALKLKHQIVDNFLDTFSGTNCTAAVRLTPLAPGSHHSASSIPSHRLTARVQTVAGIISLLNDSLI